MLIVSLKKYEDYVKPRLLEVGAWSRDGLTERQIAKNLGVSYAAFRNYKKQYLALLSTLAETREIINIKVENSLLKKALGYKVTEVFQENVFNPKTKKLELQVSKKITKEVPADLGAIRLWLVNKNRNKWSDNPQMLDLKKEELEIRKNESDSKNW